MKQRFPLVPFKGGSGVLAHAAVVLVCLLIPVLFFMPEFVGDPQLYFLRWVSLAALIAAVLLINSVFFTNLTLNQDGIEYRSLFQRRFFTWPEITALGFYRIQPGNRNATAERIEENLCTSYSNDYILVSKKKELPDSVVLRAASDHSICIIHRPELAHEIRRHKPDL